MITNYDDCININTDIDEVINMELRNHSTANYNENQISNIVANTSKVNKLI